MKEDIIKEINLKSKSNEELLIKQKVSKKLTEEEVKVKKNKNMFIYWG